jgi:hypothetical protein
MAASARSNGDATVVVDRKVIDFEALLNEARSGDAPPVVFDLKGTEFMIPPPLEWSDEALELQTAAARQDANSPAAMVGLAKELLGGQYAKYRELGGTALNLSRVLDKLLGVSVGESSAS